MNTSARLHLVIVLIFSLVFLASTISFWQLSKHDIALETQNALYSAQLLIDNDTPPAVLHQYFTDSRHVQVTKLHQEQALTPHYIYHGERYYVLPDDSSELDEITVTIGLFFALFAMALMLILFSVKRVLNEKEQTIHRIQQQLVHIQEQERRHLAMELHDNVSQIISGIHVNAYMLQTKPEAKDNVLDIANKISKMCEELKDDTRSLINSLHPVMLSRLGFEQGLAQFIAATNESAGITINVDNQLDTWNDNEDRDIQIFRICQESIQNTIRHARATQIDCRLFAKNNDVFIDVTDNGIGFEPNTVKPGVGFHSMQERARIAGCELNISSQPNNGTRIRVSFKKD
jgi:signal transduction histidine kinase